MARSLYFDDERRDVQEDLYSAFKAADAGDWGEAVWAFDRVAHRVGLLRKLVHLVDEGVLDPDEIEGLVPASQGAWPHDWLTPNQLVSGNGGIDESE